jgi:hypothetical protein
MDPVQAQLEAYNARDLERFLACYTPDVVIEDGAGAVLMRGHAQMRGFYGPLFAQSPSLHCEVVQRIRLGGYVVDEEQVTGVVLDGFPETVHAAAVYTLDGDRITRARMLT